MTGEVQPSAPPTNGAGGAPEPGPAASPAPVAAPAAPVAAEAVAPAPVAAEAPVAVPAAPESPPTLLEKFDADKAAKETKPAEPAKPADPAAKPASEAGASAKAPDGGAADVGADAAPAAPEPIAYEYALPETIKMDDALKGEFHTALDAFRTDPAKGAQGLVDLHNKAMQQFAEESLRNQYKVFNETRQGWQTDVMADPELGGAGYQTTMGAIARMRDMLVPEKNRESFNTFLKVTGAGDHPEFLRLLHNAARIFDEAPMPPPGARPPPNVGKAQGRGLRGMYKSNQGRQ
jgi:hypothetical protein